MNLPLRINRNLTSYLIFIQIGALLILGGLAWAITAKTIMALIFLFSSILLTLFFLKKAAMAKKEYIELTDNEITVYFADGNKRIIPISNVYEVMHCRNRITPENKVNKNFFVVELRDENRQKIIRINKSSFNQDELIRLVTYLIEINESRLVEE